MDQPKPLPFTGIRQVGHLVPDLDNAVRGWRAIGVGPWLLVDTQLAGAVYRGQASAPNLKIAFANVGELQLELIEVVGNEPSIWRDDRDAGRFGPHHVAYWVEEFDVAIQASLDRGLAVAQQFGEMRAIYLADKRAAMLVEIMAFDLATQSYGLDPRGQPGVGRHPTATPLGGAAAGAALTRRARRTSI
jgi:hypothetical protein